MEYEDLRSYFARRHLYVLELLATIEKHEGTIAHLEEVRSTLEHEVLSLKEAVKELEAENEGLEQARLLLEQQLANVESVLEKTKVELAQAKEDNERLGAQTARIPSLEARIEELEENQAELEEKVMNLTMQIEKMRGHKSSNHAQTDLCMLHYSDQETQCDDLMLGPLSDMYATQAGNQLNKAGKSRIQSAINTAHSTHLQGANLHLLKGYQSGLLSEDQTIGTIYD